MARATGPLTPPTRARSREGRAPPAVPAASGRPRSQGVREVTRGRGEGGPGLGCGECPAGQPRGEPDGRASGTDLRAVA